MGIKQKRGRLIVDGLQFDKLLKPYEERDQLPDWLWKELWDILYHLLTPLQRKEIACEDIVLLCGDYRYSHCTFLGNFYTVISKNGKIVWMKRRH